ncbi:MAG: small multi-drug export protein [Endomicrobia bacterium]|nr:small multi-drug export protein [Endomicrobiia bacterium]MDW8056370.1 small multi-drug export protein [Elusimicrobiota bacterium]
MIVATITNLLNFLRVLLNHLINIPLSLLTGLGKLYVILLAFAINMLQVVIYSKILQGINLSKKLSFLTQLFPDEKTIEQKPFFSKFRRLQYIGIFLLASLPIYTGGVCAAVTLRYISKNLDPKKSFIAIVVGSLAGCIIWVIGIDFLFRSLKIFIKYI